MTRIRRKWSTTCFVIVILITNVFQLFSADLHVSDTSSLLNCYDVKSYVIDLSVNDTSDFIEGSTKIFLSVTEPLNKLVFELSDFLKVDSVTMNDIQRSFIHKNDYVIVDIDKDYSLNSLVKLKICYKGYAKDEKWFGGINIEKYHQNNQPVIYTISEPYSAKNWFPCKQVLSDKADSVVVKITTDSTLMAVSNGLLINKEIVPEGKIRYEWKSKYPIAYYLIAFAVSAYKEYSFYVKMDNESDSLLFSNYFFDTTDNMDYYNDGIEKTVDILKLYSGLFGRYPFYKEKYGQVLTPFQGGMENQTITYLWDYNDDLIAHELAHQWFGNHVTCETFSDIWINEGFATYSEYLAIEFLPEKFKRSASDWLMNIHKRAKRNSGRSLYIPENELSDWNRIFDYDISYSKGASVIHMIRHKLKNDSLFFSILKDFQKEYSFRTAKGLDFKKVLEDKSEMDFTAFFDQWYFGKGYPELNINWSFKKKTFRLSVLQSTTAQDVTPFFNLDLDIKLIHSKGDTIITFKHCSNREILTLPFSYKIKEIKVDPDNWLLFDLISINNEKFHKR